MFVKAGILWCKRSNPILYDVSILIQFNRLEWVPKEHMFPLARLTRITSRKCEMPETAFFEVVADVIGWISILCLYILKRVHSAMRSERSLATLAASGSFSWVYSSHELCARFTSICELIRVVTSTAQAVVRWYDGPTSYHRTIVKLT